MQERSEAVLDFAAQYNGFSDDVNLNDIFLRACLLLGNPSAYTDLGVDETVVTKEMITMKAAQTNHFDYLREKWLAEGARSGIEKGIAQGMEKGIAQGKQEAREDLIQQLIRSGMSREDIERRLMPKNTSSINRMSSF